MTEQRIDDHHHPVRRPTLEEIAREKGLEPLESVEALGELALDVWDSDEDLDAFLAEVRASRRADVA